MKTTYVGDCREILDMFYEDNTFDSIVTDPPYGLSFMNRAWDHSVPGVDFWKEMLRVLKPGGYLLSFSGSRTYHRMTCAIEDAGFEIRDQMLWLYGSGFPKSVNISKAIDKAAGAQREVVGHDPAATRSPVVGTTTFGNFAGQTGDITAPVTDAAKQWAGWGTALKPAHEPICMARKPLIGTVANNVLAHGTGGINIDACRVGADVAGWGGGASKLFDGGLGRHDAEARPVHGRWPANLVHDGSDAVLACFPDTKSSEGLRKGGTNKTKSVYNLRIVSTDSYCPGGEGNASRYFYCAKASPADRNEGCENLPSAPYSHDGRTAPHSTAHLRTDLLSQNYHPTVKPTALMSYLVRLVTPAGGTVLDPFMGSGSTGKAALLEGFNFVGIDLDEGYVKIANARMSI